MKTVVAAAVFFSTSSQFFSRLLRSVLQFPWSHVGLVFWLRDDTGVVTAVYYESLFSEGVGPAKPLQKLTAWVDKAPGNRYEVVNLGCRPEEAQRAYLIAETWVNAAGYGRLQLLWMWASLCFGWTVPKSMGRVVCSELVGRVWYPAIDFRPSGKDFDDLTPKDIWGRLHAEVSQA